MRAGVSTALVRWPRTRRSERSVSQFSCKAAQWEQPRICSRAACSRGLSAAESRSRAAMANSSQVIFPSAGNCLSAGIGSPRNIAQHFELGQKQSAAAMEARTNRADWAIEELGSLVVTELFEFAEDDGFAKFDGQFQNSGANLLAALAHFGPFRGGEAVDGHGVHAVVGLFVEGDVARGALDVFHDAIASHAVEKGAKGAAFRIEFLRFAN